MIYIFGQRYILNYIAPTKYRLSYNRKVLDGAWRVHNCCEYSTSEKIGIVIVSHYDTGRDKNSNSSTNTKPFGLICTNVGCVQSNLMIMDNITPPYVILISSSIIKPVTKATLNPAIYYGLTKHYRQITIDKIIAEDLTTSHKDITKIYSKLIYNTSYYKLEFQFKLMIQYSIYAILAARFKTELSNDIIIKLFEPQKQLYINKTLSYSLKHEFAQISQSLRYIDTICKALINNIIKLRDNLVLYSHIANAIQLNITKGLLYYIKIINNKYLTTKAPTDILINGNLNGSCLAPISFLLSQIIAAAITALIGFYTNSNQILITNSAKVININSHKTLLLYKLFWTISRRDWADKLTLPDVDYNYRVYPVITGDKSVRCYNYHVVYPHTFDTIIKMHPIKYGVWVGIKETEVSINILVDLVNILYVLWSSYHCQFNYWTGVQAITELVRQMHDICSLPGNCIDQNDLGVKSDYDRAYRWLRWHGEAIILRARYDGYLNANYWCRQYVKELVQYLLDHHFDTMPWYEDLSILPDRVSEHNDELFKDKTKGSRDNMITDYK